MRLKTKSVLLVLVAVFAMSAVTAAAASAVKPEFKPVPAKKKFTISGGTSKWVYGTSTIVCAKSSATGEVDGAATVGNVVVAYSGCKSSGGGGANCPVKSTGAQAEEIVSKPLTGELGTVAASQAASGVGLLLGQTSPKYTKWFTLEKNKCTGELTFDGDLAAEFSGLGKQATHELVLQPGSSGEKIKEITLDSGAVDRPDFEAGGIEASIAVTDELKFEEPVEVT
jgi:hypothetical protein